MHIHLILAIYQHSVPLIKRHLHYHDDFDDYDSSCGSINSQYYCPVCPVIALGHDLSSLSLALNLGSICCM